MTLILRYLTHHYLIWVQLSSLLLSLLFLMPIWYILFCINHFRFNLLLNLICGSWGSNSLLECLYLSLFHVVAISERLGNDARLPRHNMWVVPRHQSSVSAPAHHHCSPKAPTLWRWALELGHRKKKWGKEGGERWKVRGIALEACRASLALRGALKMTCNMILNVTTRNTVLNYFNQPKQHEPLTWQS